MYDPHTRDSRGFGFVTMDTPEDAEAAIQNLHGTDFMGRTLNVEKVNLSRST
jgi:transformer-2 protein